MCQSAIRMFCEETLRQINAKDVEFSGKGRSTNFIARKRWLLWNKWILQWSRKRRIFMSKPSMVRCWKLSLYANESCDGHAVYFRLWLKWQAIFITFLLCNFSRIEALEICVIIHAYCLRPQTYFRSLLRRVLNQLRNKSYGYDIKSTCKYSEEYSTVDKVVSENLNLVLTCNTTIFLGTFDENLFNNQGLACSHCAKIRRRN